MTETFNLEAGAGRGVIVILLFWAVSEFLLCMLIFRYLKSILSRQNSEHAISKLVESLNEIDSWV